MMQRSRYSQDVIRDTRTRVKVLEEISSFTPSQFTTFDNWHVIGIAGQPPFENVWINFGGTEETAAFWKDSAGIVRLRGVVKSGTIPSNVFILPAGFRPAGTKRFAVITSGGVNGSVLVDRFGNVSIQAGTSTWVDLSSVSFRAEV